MSWAIRLGIEAIKRKGYTEVESAKEAREDAKRARPIDAWIEARTLPAPEGHEGSSLEDLYEDFRAYLEKAGNHKMARPTFGARLVQCRHRTKACVRYRIELKDQQGEASVRKPPRLIPPELQAHFDAMVRAGVDPIALRALMPEVTPSDLQTKAEVPSTPPLERVRLLKASIRCGTPDKERDDGRVSGLGPDGYVTYPFAPGVLETLPTPVPTGGVSLIFGDVDLELVEGAVRALLRAS